MTRPEQQIQKAIFDHIRTRGEKGIFAFAIPNGGYRRKVEANILKGQGVKAGVPDICIIARGKPYFLELKSESGRISPAQKEVLDALYAAGATAGIAFGLDQALNWLEINGLLRGRAG